MFQSLLISIVIFYSLKVEVNSKNTTTDDNVKLVNNGTHYILMGYSTLMAQKQGFNKRQKNNKPILPMFKVPLIQLGEQYYLFSNYYKLNFFEAFRFCEDLGLDLLSINTKAENDFVTKFARSQLRLVNNMWTSGQKLGDQKNFYWLSTGDRIGYTNWEDGEPYRDERGHCVQLQKTKKSLKWTSKYCWDSAHFLCEMKSCPNHC